MSRLDARTVGMVGALNGMADWVDVELRLSDGIDGDPSGCWLEGYRTALRDVRDRLQAWKRELRQGEGMES